jgi:hypothetical protein
MNALFGTVIKFFLALVQADDAVGKDDGNCTDGWNWRWVGHCDPRYSMSRFLLADFVGFLTGQDE